MKLNAIFTVLLSAAAVHAATFTGSLQFTPTLDDTDGIYATGPNWAGNTITMSWTVTNEDASHPGYDWRYSYEFNIGAKKTALSHIIIETSPSFTRADIIGIAGAALECVELQKVQSGNPDMPSDVYGLRFSPNSETLDAQFSFFSDRAPVWGDFFAKGGHGDIAYNRGLTAQDCDPASAPGNGSFQNHILRPDKSSCVVPLPAASWAGMVLGIAMAAVRIIHRRRLA